jgi:hypothetical protein
VSSSHRGRSRHHRALPPPRRRLRLLLLMSLDIVDDFDSMSSYKIFMRRFVALWLEDGDTGGKKRAT